MVKKIILLVLVCNALLAQEDETFVPPPPKPKDNSEFQNWLFAGGSIIAATVAVILVALNPGKPPPSDQGTPL